MRGLTNELYRFRLGAVHRDLHARRYSHRGGAVLSTRAPPSLLPQRYSRDPRAIAGSQCHLPQGVRRGSLMPVNFNTPLNRTRALEWHCAFSLLVYGWAVLDPSSTFFDMPIYVVMKNIAPEFTWGITAMTVAALRLVALYINGWWRRTPIIRFVGASVGGMFWVAVGASMYFGAEASGQKMTAGLVLYIPLFFSEGWCVMSTGYDMIQEGLFGTRPPKRYVAGRS